MNESDINRQQEIRAVRNAIEAFKRGVASAKRKHSWRPSERAMAMADYQRDIEALERVLERL